MKSNLVLLSSCLLLTASPVAMAQSANNQQAARASASNSTNEADAQDFVQGAAIGNMTEIQIGQLAEQKSRNERIKSFAQDLVEDHQSAQRKLRRQAGDYTLPTRLDSQHQQLLADAQNANGAEFDRLFVQMQIEAHQNAIDAYQQYANQGSDPGLKRYAQNVLPVLRQHLQMAENLQQGGGAQASDMQQGRSQRGGRAPTITVRQGQPDVTVNQKQPQITVRQAPPRVTIEQPQPVIIVRMPEPDVNVQRSRPQVSVQMPRPRVNVIDQSSGDIVDINRAERPQVNYERIGQPQVNFRQVQGQPRIRYEDMNGNPIQVDDSSSIPSTRSQSSNSQSFNSQSGQNARTQTTFDRNTNRSSTSGVAETNVGDQSWNNDWATIARTRASAGDNAAERGGRAQQIRVSTLLDRSLYNAQGDDLGDVEQVVLNTDDNQRYLVLASGGFLGLFEDKVAIPLQRVRYENGRLVVRGLTEDDIDQMQDWQRMLPHRRVLQDNDTASLTYAQNS